MALIFTAHERVDSLGLHQRSIRMFNTLATAQTGRWCVAEPGAYPDRCNCIGPDLQNGRATHFAIEYGIVDGKRIAYRHGVCADCTAEYLRFHPKARFYPILPQRAGN
jgi:hypothetical protein